MGRGTLPTAIVESVFEHGLREINALEARIVKHDDDMDALLWDQARQVVAQLDTGLTQRELAAQWINGRTGEPYSQSHVRNTVRVVSEYLNTQPRPRFQDAYNEIANASNRLAHYSGDFEWYTPPEILDAARIVLGGIDLDPASCAAANDVVQAARFYTSDDDGLAQPWHGRVWLNPPYVNKLVTAFAEKLVDSVRAGTVPAAIVICNNATETQWFRRLEDVAAAICLPTGRVYFWKPKLETDAPLQGQVVFYVGGAVDEFRAHFGAFGPVWVR